MLIFYKQQLGHLTNGVGSEKESVMKKMIRSDLIKKGLFFFLGFSVSGGSYTFAAPPAVVRPHDFHEDLDWMEQQIENLGDTPEEISLRLNDLYRVIYAVQFKQLEIRSIRLESGVLIQRIFQMRLRLSDQLRQWWIDGKATAAVVDAYREVYRAGIYAEDMIGELAAGLKRAGPRDRFLTPMEDIFPYLLRADKKRGGTVKFKGGDIIIERGVRTNSAAIARVGDGDAQYSHLVLIHEDADGIIHPVEALIEEGLVSYDLHHLLTQKVARMSLFRARSEEVAQVLKLGAKIMYEKVLESQRLGVPVPYNFGMQLTESMGTFCSNVARQALAKGWQAQVEAKLRADAQYVPPPAPAIPTFPTRMRKLVETDFLRRVGVEIEETFAPSDVQEEPLLRLFAEWRDFKRTAELRAKDMALTKVFEWMENEDYRLGESFLINSIGYVFIDSYSAPLWKWGLKTFVGFPIPPWMTRDQLQTMIMLEVTVKKLTDRLNKYAVAYEKINGVPMHPELMKKHLELIRKASNGRIGYLRPPDVAELMDRRRRETERNQSSPICYGLF